jgi:hypothetical protein
MAYSAKDIAKDKLLKYLGDPENDFVSRAKLSNEVLGYKNPNQINCLFTAAELQEIEAEAFEIRKKNSSKNRAELYGALYREGKKGNVQAIKEYLDRVEGKVTDKHKIEADVTTTLSELSNKDIDAEIDRLLNEKDK